MSALHDLVRDACRAPADDGPRLRIAAALGEADPLGRYIPLPVARTLDDRRHGRRQPTVAPGEDALRPAATARWVELCPELAFLETSARGLGLVRGMVGRARVFWNDLARTDEWWRLAPLQHLDVRGRATPEDVARLAAWPPLPHLESLSLAGCGLGDAGAAGLAGADLRALRWLDLTENDIGRAGASALVASRTMPRLVIAHMRSNRVDPREIARYGEDLGTDPVYGATPTPAPADEFGNTPDDYVQETSMSPPAAEIAREHGRGLWTRVLWRSRREIPHRECVWPGLADAGVAGEDLGGAVFLGAALERVRAAGARARGANLAASRLDECDFSDADLFWASLAWAFVARTRFVHADLSSATLEGARVMDSSFAGADLSDALLAGAEFVDSSFQGARLGRAASGIYRGRTLGTRFVRCDFRGADLDGRELDDTRFIDCTFAGTAGVPRLEGPVTIERPDFSARGDRSDVRAADELLARWDRRPDPR